MSRRRRPHPARRARRVAGASAIGAYVGLMASVGWAHRSGQVDNATSPTPEPDRGTADAGEATGVERVDLRAAATEFASTSTVPSAASDTAGATDVRAPTPPPPPSLAVTTTVAPRATAPRPSAPPAPTPTAAPSPTAAPTTTPPTTTVTPPTTSFVPPTSIPPTSLPTGGS